jgi:hypothetical protein
MVVVNKIVYFHYLVSKTVFKYESLKGMKHLGKQIQK